MIDSPVYPDELEALPDVVQQAGFPVSGLLATHGDWDHLLGRLAFPEAALGCAQGTAERLRSEPGDAQRELREFDEEHYVDGRRPLALAGIQELPVPGHLDLGDQELELHPSTGHTADGMAIVVPWAKILVCGDYLSPVEIPALNPGGSAEAYTTTLARLGELIPKAEWVIPGHGAPLNRERALEIHTLDTAYLEALVSGHDVDLPEGRRSAAQRQIHTQNLQFLT